ncbi:Uncharacterised protein [Mycobacteroides abscessus subsp. abscessus]|nr:Uncharacterised protein [Mycobacteroides abscessus subsp. abscessus]
MLDRRGVDTDGRTSQSVSDALRREVRRGRLHRAGRGLLSLVAGHVDDWL